MLRRLALVSFIATLLLCSSLLADAEYVVKFASVAPDGTPWANHLKTLKKRIEAESKGRIKMKLFLGGTLGGEVEMVRALRRGRIQGWGGSTAALAEGARIDQLMLFELPFFFNSFAEADYIADEIVHDEFVDILGKKGFTFWMWHENGWRNFATKAAPIHTPADLAKLKMRSQESPVHLAMYKAMGAQAESIAVPEVLGALKTGMVDGFDNTPLFSSATGWYEGAKYYTLATQIYQPAALVFNKKFIDKMPEDLRKILMGDEKKETAYGRKAVRDMGVEILANFKEMGITVVDMKPEERAVFEKLCRPVHKQFKKRIGAKLFDRVVKAKKAYRKAHPAQGS